MDFSWLWTTLPTEPGSEASTVVHVWRSNLARHSTAFSSFTSLFVQSQLLIADQKIHMGRPTTLTRISKISSDSDWGLMINRWCTFRPGIDQCTFEHKIHRCTFELWGGQIHRCTFETKSIDALLKSWGSKFIDALLFFWGWKSTSSMYLEAPGALMKVKLNRSPGPHFVHWRNFWFFNLSSMYLEAPGALTLNAMGMSHWCNLMSPNMGINHVPPITRESMHLEAPDTLMNF